MQDETKIRELLERALSELNPANEWPVNLDRILARLGLEVTVREEPTKPKAAYLQLGEKPSIVIQRSGLNTHLPSERFSIAHELAHWVIWRRFRCLPSSHNEYWRHEALANEFAARLLVAPSRLDGFLAEQRAKQVHPIDFPSRMAAEAAVSWKVAARVLSATNSADSAYLRLIRKCEIRAGASSTNATYLRIECSSLSHRPGSFVGQSARLRQPDLLAWLTNLELGTLQSKTVTLKAGNLELTDVPCTFRRNLESWIAHFQRSHEGVRTAVNLSRTPGPGLKL